jgi:uncharacterized membrane protein
MGRLFWFFTVGLTALATHIAYVLFAPGLLFQYKVFNTTDGKPANSFFVLAPEKQSQLFPLASIGDVVGVCKYDLGIGKLVLSATLPKTYWTMSIYTESGKQVYALDDVQAGSSAISIELSQSKTMLEQLISTFNPNAEGDEAGQIENLGWRVQTTERRGLAIVWIPLADELMRPHVENIIKESRCQPKAAN